MWWDRHFGQSFVVPGDSKLILALAGPKNEDSHDTILLLSAVNGLERNREAAFTTRISFFGNPTVSGEEY